MIQYWELEPTIDAIHVALIQVTKAMPVDGAVIVSNWVLCKARCIHSRAVRGQIILDVYDETTKVRSIRAPPTK